MNGAILTGLVFGLLGSLHCVGMCGPLLLALPLKENQKLTGQVLYHGGRILCYSLMGVLLSLFGVSLRYTGLHEFFSLSIGIMMIIGLFIFLFGKSLINNSFGKSWLLTKIKNFWRSFFETKSIIYLPMIGFLNGMLPCGFVYIALGFSLMFNSSIDTSLYMVSFGLGTVPALIGIGYFSQILSTPLRQKVQIVVPFATAIVGILLILRGLSLDIPYISPVLSGMGCSICH